MARLTEDFKRCEGGRMKDQISYEDVIRKRRALARDYFANVPEKWISLDTFNFYKLTQEGLSNTCGAVGCLAGWLQTMPEFRLWAKQGKKHLPWRFDENNGAFLSALYEFFGVVVNGRGVNPGLFGSRRSPSIPQKQEAMERLDRLQTLPVVRYEEDKT